MEGFQGDFFLEKKRVANNNMMKLIIRIKAFN